MLIFLGIFFALLGLLIIIAPKLPYVGRLPGDIYIKRGGITIYFPVVTSILISIILSLILNFIFGKK
ncbi:MAG: DUF2905 domain-containing protein [Thermodesulfobacteriota bacterium]